MRATTQQNPFLNSTFQYVGGIFSNENKSENSLEVALRNGDEVLTTINKCIHSILIGKYSADLLECEYGNNDEVIKILESLDFIMDNETKRAKNHESRRKELMTLKSKNLEIISSFRKLQVTIQDQIESALLISCSSISNQSLGEIWDHPLNDVWDDIYKKGNTGK